MHRCQECYWTSRTLPQLTWHLKEVSRWATTAIDVADHFVQVFRWLPDDVAAAMDSEEGYHYHGFTVWLRHMPDTVVVWSGNEHDYNMDKVAELPLINSFG